MTCITGIIENGEVYLGADSAGVGGYSLRVRADQKVFRNGKFVMGFTSSFRMGQLLRYSFKPPKHFPDDDIYGFMVTSFVDAVRTCFKDGGFLKKEQEQEEGGTFLVGYSGRLFQIHDDYQVAEAVDNYDACGCGSAIALGSLYSTHGRHGRDLHPNLRLEMALDAAQQYSAGVRAPFHFVSTKEGQEHA